MSIGGQKSGHAEIGRSIYCGTVGESLAGTEVVLCGWVWTRRDHGGCVTALFQLVDGLRTAK